MKKKRLIEEKENPVAINRYTLKIGTTFDDVKNCGFSDGGLWIKSNCKLFKTICLSDSIELDIGFNTSDDWDDFNYVLVLDDDFCQPYTPFYGDNYGKRISNFGFLQKVIRRYNEEMDEIPFLERVELIK